MDLETEGTNSDFGEPGSKLGGVDSSANQPRSITNDNPVAHGGGPMVEKSPIQGPAPPSVNLDPIYVALGPLPVLPCRGVLPVSIITITASSLPFPLPLFAPPNPLHSC